MFVYSLDGLKIDSDLANDVEIEDNEITARSGVYQTLSKLFVAPDAESHQLAVEGKWPEKLREAADLLAYKFDFGEIVLDASVSAEDFQAEYIRLFEVGSGDGPPAPIMGGAYGNGDRRKAMEEVARFFEYFGLTTTPDDPRPPDHLATECEFMQYLAFKEAASASPRLGASFHRAQDDFLERQFTGWLKEFAAKVEASTTQPFWTWAAQTASNFAEADMQHIRS
jgi:putative dimethyl sulfoxide reductase chaperone